MTPKAERLRVEAFLLAVSSEEEGPGFSSRVRETQEDLVSKAAEGERKAWSYIHGDELHHLVRQLGGPASAGRLLGLVPSTMFKWGRRSRIPTLMLAKIAELIKARTAPIRRSRCRHMKAIPAD